MLDEQKKLNQEQHRLELAQMRNRSKEQKARTRRLIQEGSILEKVFPWVKNVADLEELENRLCAISTKAEKRRKRLGRPGRLLSIPKGALTHHRQSRRCTACGRRALYEVMRRRDTPIFLQSLHKKGSDRLSPYIILKQKSSPVVQVALQWRQPPI